MKLPIFIADAFTAKAFRGNPAAVCLLEDVSTDLEILDSCRTPYFFKKKIRSTFLFTSLVFVLCQMTSAMFTCASGFGQTSMVRILLPRCLKLEK